MKLHRTTAHPEGSCMSVEWTASDAEAGKVRKEWRHLYGNAAVKTEVVDVPTDKQGLLKFLNGRSV